MEDFVPPESFIWGDSFTNVSELIKHVLEVHNDPGRVHEACINFRT